MPFFTYFVANFTHPMIGAPRFRRKALGILPFLVLVSFHFSNGQSRQTVNQFADWFSASSTMKTSNRLSIFVDTQFRFVDGTEAMQHQFRIGGDIKITEKFSFMPLGYVYIWNYLYGKQPTTYMNNEHRVYQQFTYKHKWGSFNLVHRLRTEERFLQAHHKDTNGNVIDDGYSKNQQFRIRYRIYGTLPLTKQQDQASMAIAPKSYYLVVYDELFMSWGEYVTYHEIDQNRIFVGLGYQFTKDFTIQSGFLWQLLVKANGAQQENNIGIGTWLTYNFDFTKS